MSRKPKAGWTQLRCVHHGLQRVVSLTRAGSDAGVHCLACGCVRAERLNGMPRFQDVGGAEKTMQ